MSEIFNFLKKTEVESRKRTTPPLVDLATIPAEPPPQLEYVEEIPEPAMIRTEVGESGRFDLTRSTSQLQNALDPQTVIGEQFRLLRTRLNLMQKQSGIRKILITSTVPQEGKSFTACGLAGVMAQEPGKKVIVIDADMRKKGSGRDFGLDDEGRQVGTAQVLQGRAEFSSSLLSSTAPEFWFLPSGDLPPNPSELLSTPKMDQMLQSAALLFDWVIVDSPPIMALSDATMIAPLCDAIVLVIRANSTPSKLVLETINRIGREKICGIVLNRQKHMRSTKYYYQYYYKK